MKLQNKKTGEIGELHFEPDKEYHFTVTPEDPADMRIYKTLEALCQDWEDYKEPKGYWHIDYAAPYPIDFCEFNEDTEDDKEIGNYFETKEEAEKAVEKLKAWKRLKDCRFKFRGWEGDRSENNYGIIHCFMPSLTRKRGIWEPMSFEDIQDDLELLFGGEE